MSKLELKPTNKPVPNYYAALRQFDDLGVSPEGAVKSAFHGLPDHCARQHDWTLVPEWETRRPRQFPIRLDGVLPDKFRLSHGFWEAKDSAHDLSKEVRKKFEAGYAANLRRELPRIPFVGRSGGRQSAAIFSPSQKSDGGARQSAATREDAALFHAFAAAGKKLADLHVGYEQAEEYPLKRRENPHAPLNWRVEKMKLPGRADLPVGQAAQQHRPTLSLRYNEFLTLAGIRPGTFEYRLGNRSALEWVVDQYQVSPDQRSGITNDPNRPDDPEYIVRLLGQVITVSLETINVVQELPPLDAPQNRSEVS